MPLTGQQTRLAETLDMHVTQILAHGRGDEALLLAMDQRAHLRRNIRF
jgi:hypothetical protein